MGRLVGVVVSVLLVGCTAPAAGGDARPQVVVDGLETAPSATAAPAAVDLELQAIQGVMRSRVAWSPRRILELEVTAGDDGRLIVRGVAHDATDVAKLAQRARGSKVFTDIVLVRGSAASANTVAFELRMRCMGTRLCSPADVQRIWRTAIRVSPAEKPKPEPRFPRPSGLRLVGIIGMSGSTGLVAVMLVDDAGLGHIVKEGDARGGEELIAVGSDHAVFRDVATGKERTLYLANQP